MRASIARTRSGAVVFVHVWMQNGCPEVVAGGALPPSRDGIMAPAAGICLGVANGILPHPHGRIRGKTPGAKTGGIGTAAWRAKFVAFERQRLRRKSAYREVRE
jgi:hypothetical protein